MISKEIVDYIKGQIGKGQNKEDIKKALAAAGWQAVDIDEAFKYAQSGIPLAPLSGNMQNSYQSGQASQNTQFLSSPTDLLKEAWGIYKSRFKTFLGITLAQFGLIAIPFIVLLIVALVYALTAGVSSGSGSFMNIINFSLAGITIVVIPLFFIIIIIAGVWGQAATLIAIKDSEEGIGIKESYQRGWHKIGSVFWVTLLSGIIVMGGYSLFVIPGIIFAIWFGLAVYIVIAEGSGGMDAILKSKEYVKGYWWEVFWRFIFIGLVVFGINIAVMLLGMVIPVLPNLLMIFVTPLTVIYSFLVYKNLKAIKESKGEVRSEFSGREKIKYILAGLLGIILVFGFILGSIVLVSLNSARGKAMDASRQSGLQSLQVSLMIYADNHNGMYPSSLSQLVPEYTSNISKDPKTKLPYEYRQTNNGKDYRLCFDLDNCYSSKGKIFLPPQPNRVWGE